MSLPRTILVPTDFSECADAALAYAMDLASVTKAKIVLLHSYLTPVVAFPAGAIAHLPDVIAGIIRNAEQALNTSVGKVREANIPVEGFLKNGDPRDTILLMMGEAQVDLVCMGTHGRRGVARALIGSVAECIVRTSPIPVLTIHRAAS